MLDLLVSEILMRAHPDADEGTLSRHRADAVNTQALAEHAVALGLPRWLRLGRGEHRSGGREKPSIQANVFEAVLGALYLDGGLEAVRALVEAEFGDALAAAPSRLKDPKSQLQETLQKLGESLPRYETRAERGPAHAREFEVAVSVGGRVLATAWARSKHDAEVAAAREALEELDA